MAIEADMCDDSKAPDLSQTFVGHVESYGRSFEFGLATRHYLRHQPLSLVGKAQMGLGMLSKGRLDLTPHRIEGMGQLKAILERAKELEAEA
jgi:heterodisulfide reductase subunit C/quinone-modifying oxidoreductase subunit QmoC